MLCSPTAAPGTRFNEIGQRDPHCDVSLTKLLEYLGWPGNPVKVHLVGGDPCLSTRIWLDFALIQKGCRVLDAPKRLFQVRYAVAITPYSFLDGGLRHP